MNSLAPVGFHFSLAKSFSIAFISRQGLSPLQHTENNSQKSESLGMPPPSIFVQSLGTFLPVSGWQWKMDRTTNDERKSKHCTKCSLIKKKKFFGSTVNSTIFFPVGCQNDLNFLWAVLVCSSINCRNKPQPYEKYQPKRQPATKKAMWQDAKSRKNACAKKSNTKKINQRKKIKY